MTQPAPRYCRHCHKPVKAVRKPIRHLTQILLCVVTFGVWLPLYAIEMIDPPVYCPDCGRWAPYRRARGWFSW